MSEDFNITSIISLLRIGTVKIYKIKKFSNPEKLEEMLNLRKEGWTYQSLAMIYGVDHSSIYYLCKKYEIRNPRETISLELGSVFDLLGIKSPEIRTIEQKTYKEYLNESRNRVFPKRQKLLGSYNT